MTPITFEVIGTPAPQGSKTAVRTKHGRTVMLEGKGEGRRRHKTWRAAVAEAARDVAGHDDVEAPLDGPLVLDVEFRFPMPASRSKTVHALGRAPKTTAPDLDKLVRALGDGLTEGGLIRDDARIVTTISSKVEVVGWTGAVVALRRWQS